MDVGWNIGEETRFSRASSNGDEGGDQLVGLGVSLQQLIDSMAHVSVDDIAVRLACSIRSIPSWVSGDDFIFARKMAALTDRMSASNRRFPGHIRWRNCGSGPGIDARRPPESSASAEISNEDWWDTSGTVGSPRTCNKNKVDICGIQYPFRPRLHTPTRQQIYHRNHGGSRWLGQYLSCATANSKWVDSGHKHKYLTG